MADAAERRGLVFILSSPSGAGKSTIARRLIAENDDMTFSVSVTSRPPRVGEVDGEDYHFRSREDFMQMVGRGEMLEHAEVFGNLYGTPRAPVSAAIDAGKVVIFDVDWQGAQQIANSPLRDAAISVFILPPSIAALEERLKTRAQDSDEVIWERMEKSRTEISHWAEYDYVLVNDDLDACQAEVAQILTVERMKRHRQLGLTGVVAALNAEFEMRRRR